MLNQPESVSHRGIHVCVYGYANVWIRVIQAKTHTISVFKLKTVVVGERSVAMKKGSASLGAEPV